MTLETSAIQRFLDLVKRAAQARSRDLRIEINDATILASELATVLARLASQETTTTNRSVATTMDGGSLNSKPR